LPQCTTVKEEAKMCFFHKPITHLGLFNCSICLQWSSKINFWELWCQYVVLARCISCSIVVRVANWQSRGCLLEFAPVLNGSGLDKKRQLWMLFFKPALS